MTSAPASAARTLGGSGTQVLADFGAGLHSADFDELGDAESHFLSAQSDGAVGHAGARAPPAALVELVVVGDVAFGDGGKQLAVVDEYRAVVQCAVSLYRCADNAGDVAAAGLRGQFGKSLVTVVEQGGVVEKVGAGVAGDAHFGEDGELHALVLEFLEKQANLLYVCGGVADCYAGYRGGYAQKSIFIHR